MKDKIKKIGVVVFFIAGLVIPQYAEQLKAMEADPQFWTAVAYIVGGIFAWLDKTPEQIINKMKKKDEGKKL